MSNSLTSQTWSATESLPGQSSIATSTTAAPSSRVNPRPSRAKSSEIATEPHADSQRASNSGAVPKAVSAVPKAVSGSFGNEDLASRLISETAHDLRAPLSTIREAVRLVRDGDLGHVSSTQKECLTAAMNQCTCASQLVDEMVQSGRFDTGFPNIRRQWIDIDDLRQSVESTLQPFVLPREIHLLWDGPFGRGETIYGDPILLRRLIVNLANNAIRATRDGQPVLIRAQLAPQSSQMRWAIVDQGTGISASDLELIAAGQAPSRSVGGLGLMISRQLAAAHFSTLRVESRVGTGTAVSFATAMGGPSSVARNWAKWRSTLMAPSGSAIHDHSRTVHDVIATPPVRESGKIMPPRRVRIDVPSLAVELSLNGHRPVFPDSLAMTAVTLGATVNSGTCDEFDALVARSMRISELSYRVGRRHWILAWDADRPTAAVKRDAIQNGVNRELPDLRLTWGDTTLLHCDAASETEQASTIAGRLSDLMIRKSLYVSKRNFADANQVRLGTTPLQPSAIAAMRLEKEVRRLRK